MAVVDVNGVALYYEVRGDGPPIVFVSGAGGDAGYWDRVADALADQYLVVTYDRRGNSRSGRPPGYTSTSVAQHGDDAGGLIDALDLAPAVVYGLSSGAMFTVELVLRHPELVRAAFMHEPPYIAASSNPEQVAAGFQALAEQGMQHGGPPAAMELFLRLVCGDAAYDALDRELLDRVLGSSEVFFGVEMPAQGDYLPDEQALRDVAVPCTVTAGAADADPTSPLHWNYEAARWLADRLGARFAELPGGHVPSLTHPDAFVAFLREELDSVS